MTEVMVDSKELQIILQQMHTEIKTNPIPDEVLKAYRSVLEAYHKATLPLAFEEIEK